LNCYSQGKQQRIAVVFRQFCSIFTGDQSHESPDYRDIKIKPAFPAGYFPGSSGFDLAIQPCIFLNPG
jgi:hypothetical protein